MNIFLNAHLTLFFNKTDHQELKQGQPAFFLEGEKRQQLFEEPTHFLNSYYVYGSTAESPHTWAKAAYSLKSWFQYLQAINRDWPDASEEDRCEYRDAYLTGISPKTGRPYSGSGVRDSMTVVRLFYKHCSGNGLYYGDIGGVVPASTDHRPMDQDALVHTRLLPQTKSRDRALPKVRPGTKIHPIRVQDLTALLQYIGPQAGDRRGDERPSRDRLICDLGWVVGLRLDEINNLTTLQFLNLNADTSTPLVNMPLTIHNGKGKKTRQVAIPTWLVVDALAYIAGERAQSLKAKKTKSRNFSTRLLLAHASSKSAGSPITNGAIQKMFRQSCFATGLINTVDKKDLTANIDIRAKVPKHSIHDLRHTYAVLTYHAERAGGNSEPWKKIQAQLGHENLQTTIDTYLKYVEIFNEKPGLIDVRKMIGL